MDLVMRNRSSPDLRDALERYRPKRGSGYLWAGCFQQGSSMPLSLQIVLYFSDCWDSAEPPFDRHDWVVRRPRTGEEVRYVIDYYSAPPTPDGEPAFALDVRPALDSMKSMRERLSVGMDDIWETMRERGWGKSPS